MSVWITQASARMVSASTQTVRSAANAPSGTTWITLESTVLVRCSLKLKFVQHFLRINALLPNEPWNHRRRTEYFELRVEVLVPVAPECNTS